jgi:hypothetical protein
VHPDQLPGALLFEGGAHPRHLAFGREHADEGPFAQPPSHAGEIEQARAAFQNHRVDAVFGHEPPRLFDPRAPFIVGDRHDAGGHWLERTDRCGHLACRARVAAAARSIGGALRLDRVGGWSGHAEAGARSGCRSEERAAVHAHGEPFSEW